MHRTSTLTNSTCTVPNPINAAGQVSFSITTALPTASLQRPDRRLGIFYALLLPGLLGMVFAGGSRRSRYLRGLRIVGFIAILGFSTLGLGSCGGTSRNSSGGTTKGTYNITVTGTSGTASSSTAFQLVVQ